jgi:hypothetical protein
VVQGGDNSTILARDEMEEVDFNFLSGSKCLLVPERSSVDMLLWYMTVSMNVWVLCMQLDW